MGCTQSSESFDDIRKKNLLTVKVDEDLHPQELHALRRIQKSQRRINALSAAAADNHWKLFAQVDQLEENETMHLSGFMHGLVALVPGAKAQDDENAPSAPTMKESVEVQATEILLESIILEDETDSGRVITDLKDHAALNYTREEHEPFNFRSSITPEIFNDLVELFRPPRVGLLHVKALTRVLKNVYKKFKDMPNIHDITMPDTGKVTVVGDIHGQLEDLLIILDEAGEPSPKNFIIFNGDFVDRGAYGFECVTLIFTMMAAYPEYVFLNRGNHEDMNVCCNYGFQREVYEKYDQLTFMLFVEIFKYIPLFSIINKAVFIVHGGLFHDEEVRLQDLLEINRSDYEPVPPIPYPINCEDADPAEQRKQKLKQLQRDALWSDPSAQVVDLAKNTRGAGVLFGRSATQKFLYNNKLQMIIRSHEMARHGTEFPFNTNPALDRYYDQEEADVGRGSLTVDPFKATPLPLDHEDPLLVTLFSASNYQDGDNEGAYLTLRFNENYSKTPTALAQRDQIPQYANKVGADDIMTANGNPSTGLYFTCHRYRTSIAHGAENDFGLEKTAQLTAIDLLLRKRRALVIAFKTQDPTNFGICTRVQWASIMQEVTGLKILWMGLIASIVPQEAQVELKELKDTQWGDSQGVRYMMFIDSLKKKNVEAQRPRSKRSSSSSSQIMDVLYGNKKRMLETIFYYFDENNDGEISREEFRNGCDALNEDAKTNKKGVMLTNIDATLDMMDFNGTGTIDINEFFESFRLVSIHNGDFNV